MIALVHMRVYFLLAPTQVRSFIVSLLFQETFLEQSQAAREMITTVYDVSLSGLLALPDNVSAYGGTCTTTLLSEHSEVARSVTNDVASEYNSPVVFLKLLSNSDFWR